MSPDLFPSNQHHQFLKPCFLRICHKKWKLLLLQVASCFTTSPIATSVNPAPLSCSDALDMSSEDWERVMQKPTLFFFSSFNWLSTFFFTSIKACPVFTCFDSCTSTWHESKKMIKITENDTGKYKKQISHIARFITDFWNNNSKNAIKTQKYLQDQKLQFKYVKSPQISAQFI